MKLTCSHMFVFVGDPFSSQPTKTWPLRCVSCLPASLHMCFYPGDTGKSAV